MLDKDIYKKIFLDIEKDNTFDEDDSDLLEHNYQTVSYELNIFDSNGTKRIQVFNPSLVIEPTMVPDYEFSDYILDLIEPIFKETFTDYIEFLEEEKKMEEIKKIKKIIKQFYDDFEDDIYQNLSM